MNRLFFFILAVYILGAEMVYSQETVIYSNSFVGDSGLSPTATIPEVNRIADFTDVTFTSYITTDGTGKLQQSGGHDGIASYQFRLYPVPLNELADITSVKGTFLIRAPKNDWIAFSFGNYHSNNRPFNGMDDSNTWFLVSPTGIVVHGGEGLGSNGSEDSYPGIHSPGDILIVEYTYYFNKTVDLVINGTPIVKGLSIIHMQDGIDSDPMIKWFLLTMRKQPAITDGGAYVDELSIEVTSYPEEYDPGEVKRSLKNKEVFSNNFPLTLSFRNDRYGLVQGYDFWEQVHSRFQGITKKYLKEEIDIAPGVAHLASLFSKAYPEKLMLLHLNGECTSAEDYMTHKTFSPGHWVYMPGTISLENIGPSQKEIKVESAALFSMEAHTIHGGLREGEKLPNNILLVKLDENGNRLWNESEYAILEAVDYGRNTITLRRGQYYSSPVSFESGKTYIAPIASDHWGGYMMWYFNMSTSCPLDHDGKCAADIWLEQIQKWFGTSGILQDIDGIGFDVLYFDQSRRKWDLDNDGFVDGGVIAGKNTYRLGIWKFLKNLRNIFGDEFLITADGWADEMQCAVGVLNGMETEGHCRPNDGYRQVSRTINQHTYWNRYNDTGYSFSYITEKLRHVDDDTDEMRWPLRRMGLGLTCCLGVTYAMTPPMPAMLEAEIFGGQLNKPGWLGNPIADMVYVLENSSDLLEGNGIEMNSAFIDHFEFNGSSYRNVDGELFISGDNPNSYALQEIMGPDITLPQGDLLVFVEARALDGLYDLDEDTRVPRKFNIKLDGYVPDSDEPPFSRNFGNQLSGFMGTAGYTPMSFYFRDQGRSNGSLRLIFEAEEQGTFAIRNLRVYNAPCILAREFEHGVVLVNTSLNPFNFDLTQLYPDIKQFMHLNGIAASNVTEVPGLDALFLIKDSPQDILKPEKANDFILYPNPANSVINCVIHEKWGEDNSWSVHDALGRTYLSGTIKANERLLTIDISGLKQGSYFFKLISGEIIQHGKFMKYE